MNSKGEHWSNRLPRITVNQGSLGETKILQGSLNSLEPKERKMVEEMVAREELDPAPIIFWENVLRIPGNKAD